MQEAVNFIPNQVYHKEDTTLWTPRSFITASPATANNKYDVTIEHFCNGVVYPHTGETITQYKRLKNNPVTKGTWTTTFGKEFGKMAQ